MSFIHEFYEIKGLRAKLLSKLSNVEIYITLHEQHNCLLILFVNHRDIKLFQDSY